MKILVTNDDGIHSPGLWAAVEAMKESAQIFVASPDRDQSGVGASLTLRGAIRAREVPPLVTGRANGVKAYSVEGTPGDSCVLALERLVGPVDLLVSGINLGSNLGEDVLISGTVGAAFQGYFRGCPSIAISVAALEETRFDVASALLRLLVTGLAQGGGLPPCLVNINIPNEPATRIEGVQVTRLGGRSYGESVTESRHGRNTYYWLSRNRPIYDEHSEDEDTDIWALRHNRISITPIHSALTDVSQIPAVERLFQEYSRELLGPRD